MAEFKISRFRYTWKGDWTDGSTSYNRDDVVYYQGSAWVCIRQHTSDVFNDAQTFTPPGETFATPGWVKMSEGREFVGNWTTSTRYDPGVLVLAGGNVYICLTSHVAAANFNSDSSYWEVFAVGTNFRNNWEVSTRYRVGDVVRYNGYTYTCVLEHSSSSVTDGVQVGNNDNIEDSTAETWNVVVENYTYVGSYAPSTNYRKNDLVKYGASVLKCVTDHTSSSLLGQIGPLGIEEGEVDGTNFVMYLPGFEYNNNWSPEVYYAIGDVVKYGGTIYLALAHNYDSQPGISELDDFGGSGNPAWAAINKGIRYLGDYDSGSNAYYLEGDVVRRGGSLWVSLANQYTDDSSLRPLDTSNWEVVILAQNFRGSWRNDQNYNLYDVVYFRGTGYYANTPHISSFDNFPGDNGSGFNYWVIVFVGDQDAALTIQGDMLSYNLKRNTLEDGSTIATIGDGSTFGTVSVPIGQKDQLLYVEDNTGNIGYKTWGSNSRIFYVRTTGVDDDDPTRGTTFFKPYKTIRYALEKADDGYTGFTSVQVSTGEYQEILPLIVPARTAVVGEELRSVTIRANEPIAALVNDAPYTLETLIRIGTILSNLIQGIPIVVSAGNTTPQNRLIPASTATATIVDSLWGAIISTIDYKVNDEGNLPSVTGTNTLTTNASRLEAVVILENNREFVKDEAIAFMAQENPDYLFDTDKCRRDLDRFINAVQYDLQYPGNYKSVFAGRYYANAVTGSQLDDMFYVRDTTGVRNVTLKGLAGTLPDLAEGETYRIPTGGAYISLDPGWGPADTRTWINNRSPYIQNVTTFGVAAIGQKVDGLLHDGGNKSIVSNDFTQVISDGIGAWMLNGGRGELVSVFSYYAHIGMFAASGGVIRATNGNSSYGDFGAVADGLDPDETVRYGYINTRTEQAIVSSAFAGEILDFIFALEFTNCGQNYTTARYDIVSSGAGAVTVQEEFRDNAMFECQVLTNGANFNQAGNQAQTGNELTITLAAAENSTESELLGMRIIIASGPGTGQYGYIYAYNVGTKLCTVYRESDNQPGWDHILPGTVSSNLLTSGTRYRIEPRIEFSEPEYTASTVTLENANAWAGAIYGETSETFTGVIGQFGTGETVDVTPAVALFTVIKTNRTYTVSLTNGGAGYAVNDTLTIEGSAVGGIDVEHDITIKVLEVSDDSTNSIIRFEVVNGSTVAASGKFILAPSAGHFGQYSVNAETWQAFDFPTDGNWKCLAAGDNKFVAIANGSNNAASSTNGSTWTARSMPSSRNWNGVAYGKPSTSPTGVFVAVAGNLNSAAYSTNGTTWTASTLPTFGDSTFNEWVDIAFGNNLFVAIANSGNIAAVGTWNGNGSALTWQGTIMDAVSDSSQKNWVSVAYGNRRFVAISSTGDIAYSFNGLEWVGATAASQDGSTAHSWQQIRYGQGVFFAVGTTGSRTVGADPTAGPSTYAATSYDGIVWTGRELADIENWGVIAFGNPDVTLGDSTVLNNKPTWVAAPTTSSTTINKIYAGAKALGRVEIGGSGISAIKIWEPGSGYIGIPTVTFTDPSKTADPTVRPRLADGVLAQPTFVSKGAAYKSSTTIVSVVGDGFADITPTGRFLTLDNLTLLPGPGAQFYIGGSESYRVAVITGINQQLLPNGTIRSTFQVSPRPTLADFIEHDMEVVIREKYSQVRITGHDFLDIGSGNFEETNYPVLYKTFEYTTQPFQEVQNLNGGRVFYTSTDQDGNFRAGEQFAVEQSTGIITISADFFDLAGLTELRLAGINVGSTAVIREFSKDPLFLQNSNNIIPTQRAVKSYLSSRLNVGGEDLLTPSITGGLIKIGPTSIESTVGFTINVPVVADFSGSSSGVGEGYVAQTMFFKSFK